MSDVAIRVEGLGKKYLIGAHEERADTFRDAMVKNAAGLVRNIGLLARGRVSTSGPVEEFWALREIDFEIKQGEAVGVIGRNGAGKSTLLKLLSRITEPTEGRITANGRIASLLEVGTGFHPELTGRENIYLNGAIIGMTRAEIKRKFDEIVDFAGVEKFLDTPVKRYSSGMGVRLGFAVAAHLEPEILIVDEVLAVGDAEFQKKCLGKMNEVAGEGRTVLFVSHSMPAIERLCTKCILLNHGKMVETDSTREVVKTYQKHSLEKVQSTNLKNAKRSGQQSLRFSDIRFLDGSGGLVAGPTTGQPVNVELTFDGEAPEFKVGRVGIVFHRTDGTVLFHCGSDISTERTFLLGPGVKLICHIPVFPLAPDEYGITLFLEQMGIVQDHVSDLLPVSVENGSFFGTPWNTPRGWPEQFVLVQNDWFPEKESV